MGGLSSSQTSAVRHKGHRVAPRTRRVKHAAWNAWPHRAARAYLPGVYESRHIQHSSVGLGHSDVTLRRRAISSGLRLGSGSFCCLFATLTINIAQKNTVLAVPWSICFFWRDFLSYLTAPDLLFFFFFLSSVLFFSFFFLFFAFPFSSLSLFFFFGSEQTRSPVIFRGNERRDAWVRAKLKQRVHLRINRRPKLDEARKSLIVQRVHFSFFIFFFFSFSFFSFFFFSFFSLGSSPFFRLVPALLLHLFEIPLQLARLLLLAPRALLGHRALPLRHRALRAPPIIVRP